MTRRLFQVLYVLCALWFVLFAVGMTIEAPKDWAGFVFVGLVPYCVLGTIQYITRGTVL